MATSSFYKNKFSIISIATLLALCVLHFGAYASAAPKAKAKPKAKTGAASAAATTSKPTARDQAAPSTSADASTQLTQVKNLYRLEKYDEASKLLTQITLNAANEQEVNYYKGLLQYQNKNYQAAQKTLSAVKQSEGSDFAASAAFYEGLCLIELDKLDEAKTTFEFVLDNSKDDPELDRNAEARIEEIAQLLEVKKVAAVKYFINASAGLNYDSNILYVPDNNSAASTPYDEGGWRWSVAGDAAYRFFYTQTHDLNAKLSLGNMQSFSTDFVQADPRTYAVSLPYSRGGYMDKTYYRLTLTPSYEQLYMDFDRSGAVTNVNNAMILNTDFLLYMSDRWYSGTAFEIRQDDSLLPGIASGSDNDADAMKYTIRKTETVLIGKDKKKMLIATAGFTFNDAKGKDKKYNRPELSVLYMAPTKKWKDINWLTGLSYYHQSYNKSTAGRVDSDLAYLLGLTKTIDANWSWSANATYTINDSNEVANDYSKYLLMGSVNYSWSK